MLHTLLALSYGAFLALLAPHLIEWLGQPTGLGGGRAWAVVPDHDGLRGGRRTLVRTRWRPCPYRRKPVRTAAPLVNRYLTPQRILVTGGTGFIGMRLCEVLVAAGRDYTVLTRDPRKARDLPKPIRIATSCDRFSADTRFDAIVNLAGASVAGAREKGGPDRPPRSTVKCSGLGVDDWILWQRQRPSRHRKRPRPARFRT